MRTVPRPKRTRERVATQAELAEDTRRCREAREQHRPLAPEPEPTEGNLAACMVTFAAWKRCHCCQSLTLFVDSQARTDSPFTCGLCAAEIENLAKRLKYARLASRVRGHLAGLFANDNGTEARA